jgi:hypothetical protein
MKIAQAYTSVGLVLLFCAVAYSQKIKTVEGNTYKGVTLTYLSQKCFPKDKVPFKGPDFIDYSDMNNRFRLENNSKKEIYFLVSTILMSISPEGYVLHRKSKDAEWNSVYGPRRDEKFTGSDLRWLSLPAGFAIEFEWSGFSSQVGEHAASVILNKNSEEKGMIDKTPEIKDMIELISDVFISTPCLKSEK